MENWVDERLAKLEPPLDWKPDASRGWNSLQARQQASRASRRRVAIAAGGVVIAGVGLSAFPPTRAFASYCVDACVAQTAKVWKLLEVSSPAPDFELVDATGARVRLSDFKGKVVLLNFWATWCRPCVAEMPWFGELERAYKDRGLVVLGVAMDDDGWTAVRPFMSAHQIHYRIGLANDALAKSYGGVEALPTTFLIDQRGSIAKVHTGLVSKEVYERDVKSLLAN